LRVESIFHKTITIGIHYSSPLHNHNDFSVLIIEKVLPNTVNLRLEREEFWIKTLGTKSPIRPQQARLIGIALIILKLVSC
jgi:hypothetical protein